jgi:hypothetical protein
MAFRVIDSAAVYQCTGKPQEEDIMAITNYMLNDSFTDAYKGAPHEIRCCACQPHQRIRDAEATRGILLGESVGIERMKTLKGLALQDILIDIHSLTYRFVHDRMNGSILTVC